MFGGVKQGSIKMSIPVHLLVVSVGFNLQTTEFKYLLDSKGCLHCTVPEIIWFRISRSSESHKLCICAPIEYT